MASGGPGTGAGVATMDDALISNSVVGHQLAHSSTQGGGHLSSNEVVKARHVEGDAKVLFDMFGGKLHILRSVPILGGPLECYGPKFLFSLSYVYFMVKGMAYTMSNYALYPMLTDRYKCDTLQYQRYYTVSAMGWCIKPLTALISDAFAVFGYKKRWFLVVSVIVGGITSICFSILPEKQSSATPASILAFFTGYGEANVDILLEGLYSRRIREYPEPGPHFVSVIWVVQMIAGVIAAFVQGPLSSNDKAYLGNIIGGSMILSCIPLLIINWVGEEVNRVERMKDALLLRREERRKNRENHQPAEDSDEEERAAQRISRSDRERGAKDGADEEAEVGDEDMEEEYDIPTCCGEAIEFNREVLVRNYRISVICLTMSAIVVATAFIIAFHDGYTLLVTGIVGSVLITAQMFWALPLVVAKAGLFSFLNYAIYIPTTPLNGFYLENAACPDDYPQFSYFFYNTITGVIGSVAGLIGVVGFAFLFSKLSYRVTFVITIIARVVGSAFDLILVERWNIDIGIPDRAMFLFGDAVVFHVAYMLGWMPLVILMSKLCPRGSEAMVYALLAAFSNYGMSVASIAGVLLMQWAWPIDSFACHFGNLWKLIVLGHFITPLFGIPFAFLLLPSARICDEIDSDGKTLVVVEKKTDEDSDMQSTPLAKKEVVDGVMVHDQFNSEPVA